MSTTAPGLQVIEDDPSFTVGDRIRKQRKAHGWEQKDLAALVGVSRPLISKWERGVSLPNVEQAWTLAQVLDCSFGWLCGVPSRSRCESTSEQVSGDVVPIHPGQGVLPWRPALAS